MTKTEIAGILTRSLYAPGAEGREPVEGARPTSGSAGPGGDGGVRAGRADPGGRAGKRERASARRSRRRSPSCTRPGRLEFYEQLKAATAPGLIEMLQIPGLGPGRSRRCTTGWASPTSPASPPRARRAKSPRSTGSGRRPRKRSWPGSSNREAYGRRHLWWDAWEVAEPIVAGLRALPEVQRAEAAGSLRRGLETVGDLDFHRGGAGGRAGHGLVHRRCPASRK